MEKLDAHSLSVLDDGFPVNGIDVTIRINSNANYIKQLIATGMKVYSVVNKLYTGHIDTIDQLKEVVKLDFVESVGFAKPLEIY